MYSITYDLTFLTLFRLTVTIYCIFSVAFIYRRNFFVQDMSRTVVMSDYAALRIPELDFEAPYRRQSFGTR